MKLLKCASILLLAMVAGCAFTPHEFTPAATAPATASSIGEGTKVQFRFVDERDDVTIGNRGVGGNGAKISAGSLTTTMENNLRGQLAQKKFQLVNLDQPSDARVTYRLRAFKYGVERGFWSGGQNISAVLAVDGVRAGRDFTQVYRVNDEQRIQVIPGSDSLDVAMNQALNDLLTKADADQALARFLAGQQ